MVGKEYMVNIWMKLVSKQENENNKNNCNLQFKNNDGEIKEFVLPYDGYLSDLSTKNNNNNTNVNMGGKRRTRRRRQRSNKKRTNKRKKTKTRMKKRKTSKRKTNKRRRKR
jgi:hypothetical protein